LNIESLNVESPSVEFPAQALSKFAIVFVIFSLHDDKGAARLGYA